MARYLVIFCLALISLSAFAQNEQPSTTTYYFIRHAEKEVDNPLETDAHLTEEGRKRAQNWSDILQHVRFDAVYTTDFNRTKETGQPTATKNQLEIITYSVSASYDDMFKTATKGKTVLVVGHSNNVPDFVNTVIGTKKYKNIEDSNNGNLYIVTITDGIITDIMLTIN